MIGPVPAPSSMSVFTRSQAMLRTVVRESHRLDGAMLAMVLPRVSWVKNLPRNSEWSFMIVR